jgi:hypothetical protein
MAKEIPVYLFVGFLESGKTKFIQETFEDPNFDSGDKTLLLICEEGEEEYNPKKFAFPGVTVKVIEDKAEMNPQNLAKLEKESGAGRVVIEYNGMWLLQELADALPENWLVYQCIATADGTTALTYARDNSMRSLLLDKIARKAVVNMAGQGKVPQNDQAGQTQRGADGGRGNGQGQRHAHNDGYQNAHDQRSLFGGPHDQGAHLTCGSANGCGDQHGKAHAGKNGHQRGHEDVHAGLLAHGLAQLGSHDGNDEHGQRAACAAQSIGRVAYGNQAEQHQRRAVQRPANGAGHGRAAHGRGVAAKVYQHVKAGLLAQRLDDGADQQAGKQALRHGTQRFNEIALRGDDDILAF